MKEIVIIGAGQFGREVVWLIEEINKRSPKYIILGFLDDAEEKQGQVFHGYRVLGRVKELPELNRQHRACAVIAMQDCARRKAIAEMFPGFTEWETIMHPSVNMSGTSKIGKGCIVCAGGNISVDTEIGDFCLLNITATIGHDCRIGSFVSVMSGSCVSGSVVIGDGAYLGTNCTILPGMKVGAGAVVGAGSVVLRNVKDGTTVMGVPAKKVMF